MPNVQGLNHITINVVDLEKSFFFYEEVLEFNKLSIVDMGDHRLYYYALPNDTRLELIDYDNKKGIITYEPASRGVYRHIAFNVHSIDEMLNRCNKFKVHVRLLPVIISQLSAKIMLIEDPNGVEIELVEKI